MTVQKIFTASCYVVTERVVTISAVMSWDLISASLMCWTKYRGQLCRCAGVLAGPLRQPADMATFACRYLYMSHMKTALVLVTTCYHDKVYCNARQCFCYCFEFLTNEPVQPVQTTNILTDRQMGNMHTDNTDNVANADLYGSTIQRRESKSKMQRWQVTVISLWTCRLHI